MVSALIMAGLLFWLFVETSAQIATYFSQAVSAGRQGAGGNTVFKVQEASALNFRGLAIPSVESAPQVIQTPEAIPSETVPTTTSSEEGG